MHAPVLIPRVPIDAAHSKANLTPASAGSVWSNLNAEKSASTTSSSEQVPLIYLGRGVLTKCFLIERQSGGSSAFNALLAIAIDGNVIYADAACIARQSSIRVVVGNLITRTAGSLYAIWEDSEGLPFNQSCVIGFTSDGTQNIDVAWEISKKN
jgi:hypothetical protein